MNLMIAGVVLGAAFLIYGLYGIITGHSLLFGINGRHFTEKSVSIFSRLAGVLKLIAGSGIILYSLSSHIGMPIVIGWISAVIVWLCLAGIATMYMVILVKKP